MRHLGMRPIYLFLALWVATDGAYAEDAPKIGATVVVIRDVQGLVGASAAPLKKDDGLFHKETISSGNASAAQARFIDNTALTLGENSRVTLDNFVFDPSGGNQSVDISFIQGIFRFVTGGMSKPAYNVQTPAAVVGVRGTVFDIVVAADGATAVVVEEGSIQFSNKVGQSVVVSAGQASRIASADSPPSPPAPPAAEVLAPVVAMTALLAVSAPPADILPDATVKGVAEQSSAAAALAAGTSSDSPGGGLK